MIEITEKKRPLILYFIGGRKPTPEEQEEADKIAEMLRIQHVAFRNVSLINEEAPIEPNDGVAGAVPFNYLKCEQISLPNEPALQSPSNPPAAHSHGPAKGRKGSRSEGWGKK